MSLLRWVPHRGTLPPLPALSQRPGTPVLLTCSDSDSQAACASMKPLTDALARTALTFVELKGVSHVLKDDPTDSVANYAKTPDLAPQFVTALDGFAAR